MADGFLAAGAVAPYQVTEDDKARLAAAIDVEELTRLALDLGNIPSPATQELKAAEFVYDWLAREGFNPRKVGATPERPNVIGTWGGKGEGRNLLFTAHLDTESPTWNPDEDAFKYRPATVANREWESCWLQDGVLYGYPIANDRGPMSCFLIAGKALKSAGYELAGKLYLTASPGEIGPEPIEDRRGVAFMGKDLGAHYVFNHGGVAPDFAIAAEGCDFGLTWMGCGYAVFRIRIYGSSIFTPLLKTPERAADHPNPIYRLGPVLEAINGWARRYEEVNRHESPGGVAVPKVQVAAVKAGVPYSFGAGTEICSIYLETGLSPRQTVTQVQHELERLMRQAASGETPFEFDVEPVVCRHGYEADAVAVAPLVAAVDGATRLSRGHPVERAQPVYSSMWRDHNVFNMQRIPAVTTGFKRWRPTPQDLYDSALIYALTALAVCGPAEGAGGAAKPPPVYGDNPFGDD